jgi:hypothetical protein
MKHQNKGWSKHVERNQKIADLFREMKSTRLVADEVGMSVKMIGYILNRQGIPTPRTGMRCNPYAACDRNSALVLKMCSESSTLNEMAEAVGTVGREVKKFLRRNGVTKEFPKAPHTGDRHHQWKGRTVDKDGYILIHHKGHPNARKHSHFVLEHRLVMESALGRHLLPTEVVHHRDGNKQNNQIENLQLFASNGEHLEVDLAGRCPKWSEEGKARILEATRQRWLREHASSRPESELSGLQCI